MLIITSHQGKATQNHNETAHRTNEDGSNRWIITSVAEDVTGAASGKQSVLPGMLDTEPPCVAAGPASRYVGAERNKHKC